MDIERIREFCHLADSLSFSRTAAHFYISQSVLSKHIAALEDEVGVRLFVRSQHGVTLSEAGTLFHRDAQRIVAECERALFNLKSGLSAYRSSVRIGYVRNAARPFISRFYQEMTRRHPDIRVALRCMEYGEAMHALSTKGIDMAITLSVGPGLGSRFAFEPIYRDRFMAVLGFEHELAALEALAESDLIGQRFLLPDSEIYHELHDFAARLLPRGVDPASQELYRDVDTLFLKVATGALIGFSSEHNRPLFEGSALFKPLVGMPVEYQVGVAYEQADRSCAIEASLEMLRECSATLAKDFARREAKGEPRFA